MCEYILIVRDIRERGILRNKIIFNNSFELISEWCEAVRHYEELGYRMTGYYTMAIGPTIKLSKKILEEE